MWLTVFVFTVSGILLAAIMAVLFSSFFLRRLRTVPKPTEYAPEVMGLFSAETRAGIKLHEACFDNDPKAAGEALALWAWASGEAAAVNGLNRRVEALQGPQLRGPIVDLWGHLEASKKRPWFGDPLWSAFVATNPEFQDLECII